MYFLISLSMSDIMLFNILDTDTNKVNQYNYAMLSELILEGKIFVENLRYNGYKSLKAWGGGLHRYTKFDKQNRMLNSPAMIILAKRKNIYTVASPKGKVKSVDEETLIKSLQNSNWTLANGKIRTSSGKESIIPIEGGYPSSLHRQNQTDMNKRVLKQSEIKKRKIAAYEGKHKMVGLPFVQLMELCGKVLQMKDFNVSVTDDTVHIYIESIVNTAIIHEDKITKYKKKNVVIHCKGTELEVLRFGGKVYANRNDVPLHISFDVKSSLISTLDGMFMCFKSVESIDFSGLNTLPIRSMKETFNYCTRLKHINFGNIDTSKCESFSACFSNCWAIENIDTYALDTSNAVLLNEMFQNCAGLITLDISGFKTDNVITYAEMFSGCKRLKELDMRSFNIHKKANTYRMLQGVHCKLLGLES